MTHTWQVGLSCASSTMLIGGARVSALQTIRLSVGPLRARREPVQAQNERHHKPDGEGGDGQSNTDAASSTRTAEERLHRCRRLTADQAGFDQQLEFTVG